MIPSHFVFSLYCDFVFHVDMKSSFIIFSCIGSTQFFVFSYITVNNCKCHNLSSRNAKDDKPVSYFLMTFTKEEIHIHDTYKRMIFFPLPNILMRIQIKHKALGKQKHPRTIWTERYIQMSSKSNTIFSKVRKFQFTCIIWGKILSVD